MQGEITKRIKIGYTTDIKQRIKGLQLSESVELLGFIKDAPRQFEKEIHDRFSHLRLTGEWFEGCQTIAEYASQRSTNDTPDAIKNLLCEIIDGRYSPYVEISFGLLISDYGCDKAIMMKKVLDKCAAEGGSINGTRIELLEDLDAGKATDPIVAVYKLTRQKDIDRCKMVYTPHRLGLPSLGNSPLRSDPPMQTRTEWHGWRVGEERRCICHNDPGFVFFLEMYLTKPDLMDLVFAINKTEWSTPEMVEGLINLLDHIYFGDEK